MIKSECICLSIIRNDSVYRKGNNYYPQAFLEECKYAVEVKRRLSLFLTTQKFLLIILTKTILMKKTLMKKISMKKTKYIIFLEIYNKFFRFGARKFHFPKYKKVLGFASSLVKYKKFFLEKKSFLRQRLESSIS